jgi:PHD/YefM family antitoxin component YafN of YafNO toxin-antitoxin module
MSDARQTSPYYITDESGQKKAVVLSVDQYQELLEDLDDLGVIAERSEESTITHEELLKELLDRREAYR